MLTASNFATSFGLLAGAVSVARASENKNEYRSDDMRDVFISLPSPGRVKAFVDTLAGMDGDFELIDDTQILDARSLMGIFSLDLLSPVRLRIYNDTYQNCEKLRRFIVRDYKEGEGNE